MIHLTGDAPVELVSVFQDQQQFKQPYGLTTIRLLHTICLFRVSRKHLVRYALPFVSARSSLSSCADDCDWLALLLAYIHTEPIYCSTWSSYLRSWWGDTALWSTVPTCSPSHGGPSSANTWRRCSATVWTYAPCSSSHHLCCHQQVRAVHPLQPRHRLVAVTAVALLEPAAHGPLATNPCKHPHRPR